jgi:hypothetical protein
MARVIIRPEAQADIDEALGWYDQRSRELTSCASGAGAGERSRSETETKSHCISPDSFVERDQSKGR